MSTDNDAVAAVLALVQHQDSEVIEPELPPPPNGASVRAQEVWYSTLAQVDLETPGEWRLLESIIEVITQYDLVRAQWIATGMKTEATGSMGQPTESPALGTLRALRTQEAALWKQLALPKEDAQEKRRPGRPSRAAGGGAWGTR